MESILADQRNRLNEYQREVIQNSLDRLNTEKSQIVDEVLKYLDLVKYNIATDKFKQKECVICMDDFKHDEFVSKIPTCGHILHENCCKKWFKSDN